MNKPEIIGLSPLSSLKYQEHERYLPTAFDSSLTQLEKINLAIKELNKNKVLTETMLQKWNEVYYWVMNEGLDTSVGDRLVEWTENGTFNKIINENIFGELNSKIDGVIKDFDNVSEELSNEVNSLIDKFKNEYGVISEDYYMMGETIIYRGES